MSFPNLAEAFWDWNSTVTLKIVDKEINDFEVTESKIVDNSFSGILQPMPPQQLMVKPEGQRGWKFWELWTETFLALDMIVEDADGKIYRVMSRDDWGNAGYMHYELTEGVPNE